MNKLLLIAAFAVAAYFALAPGLRTPDSREAPTRPGVSLEAHDGSDAILENAFAQRISRLQVAGQGTV